MSYVALIGDMIDSRRIENRSGVQQQLKTACTELNRRAERYGLTAPFTITLGDEFQALFHTATSVWASIVTLESMMDPVAFRFSLGVGEITTEIRTDTALEMDGPAFYRAREGIERLRKEEGRYSVTGLDQGENLVHHALALVSHNREKWRHNRMVVLAGLLEGESVADIQATLEISEQAIYQNIREGALKTVAGILQETAGQMNVALEGANEP